MRRKTLTGDADHQRLPGPQDRSAGQGGLVPSAPSLRNGQGTVAGAGQARSECEDAHRAGSPAVDQDGGGPCVPEVLPGGEDRLVLVETHIPLALAARCLAQPGVERATGMVTGGRCASMAGRDSSSQGGSASRAPSSADGSSSVNPGGSVAISKSTPPGSRK